MRLIADRSELDRLLGAGVLVEEHGGYRASSIALYGSFQPAAAPFASANWRDAPVTSSEIPGDI